MYQYAFISNDWKFKIYEHKFDKSYFCVTALDNKISVFSNSSIDSQLGIVAGDKNSLASSVIFWEYAHHVCVFQQFQLLRETRNAW